MANDKKSEALGTAYPTASHKLRKLVLFDVLRRHGENVCFQCGDEIETADELSIEHKVPWRSAPDPVAAFWDLGNIAWSHLSCNFSAASREHTRSEYSRRVRSKKNKVYALTAVGYKQKVNAGLKGTVKANCTRWNINRGKTCTCTKHILG